MQGETVINESTRVLLTFAGPSRNVGSYCLGVAIATVCGPDERRGRFVAWLSHGFAEDGTEPRCE